MVRFLVQAGFACLALVVIAAVIAMLGFFWAVGLGWLTIAIIALILWAIGYSIWIASDYNNW